MICQITSEILLKPSKGLSPDNFPNYCSGQCMKIPVSCEKLKKKNTGKGHANRYFPHGKFYKSVAARCCTLWLSDISVSNWFTIYFKSEFRM